MGEVTNPPEGNHNQDGYPDEPDNEIVDEEYEEEDTDDLTSEEVAAIDSKLDSLNLALDAIESRRENIHTQLMELLESSREIRKELEEEQAMNTDSEPEEAPRH